MSIYARAISAQLPLLGIFETVNFARWNPDECQTDRLHYYVADRGTAKVQDTDRTGKMQDTVHPGDPFIGFIGSKVYTEERAWRVPTTWSTSGNVVKSYVERRHVRYYTLCTTFAFWRKKVESFYCCKFWFKFIFSLCISIWIFL